MKSSDVMGRVQDLEARIRRLELLENAVFSMITAQEDGSTYGVYIGTDGQIYRGAANVLDTPDSLRVGVGVVIGNNATSPVADTLIADGDLRSGGGISSGSSTTDPATGDVIATADGRFGGGLYVGGTGTDPGAGDITATDTISGVTITASGTLSGATLSSSGDISATDDISAGGGLYAGSSSGNPATGDVVATADGRFGGGVYAGGTGTDPASGEISASGDIKAGGGLYSGSATGNPATGDVVATADGRLGGGLYVGGTGTDPSAGTIQTTGTIYGGADMRATGGLYGDLVDVGSIHTTGDISAHGGLSIGNSGNAPTADDAKIEGGIAVAVNVDAGIGDIIYYNNLRPYRNSTQYTGYAYVPLSTPYITMSNQQLSTTGSGNYKSNSQCGVPSGAKACDCQILVQDTYSTWGGGAWWFDIGPTDTYFYQMECYCWGGSRWVGHNGISMMVSDKIYWRCNTSGSGTMYVYWRVWGYWI